MLEEALEHNGVASEARLSESPLQRRLPLDRLTAIMHYLVPAAVPRAFGLAVLAVAAVLPPVSACTSNDAVTRPGAADAAGAASANGGAPAEGGDAAAGGGVQAAAGASGADVEADAGSAGMAAGGAAAVGGDCLVQLSMDSSNAVDLATPLSEVCRATTFEGQINFEISNGEQPHFRDLNVDFFQKPDAGVSVKLEDGYDFSAGMGAAASYIDSVGVWNADSGTISIVSVAAGVYVVKLADVHFAVVAGPGPATSSGEFVANGTITAPVTLGM